jgi:hypothetical protein
MALKRLARTHASNRSAMQFLSDFFYLFQITTVSDVDNMHSMIACVNAGLRGHAATFY